MKKYTLFLSIILMTIFKSNAQTSSYYGYTFFTLSIEMSRGNKIFYVSDISDFPCSERQNIFFEAWKKDVKASFFEDCSNCSFTGYMANKAWGYGDEEKTDKKRDEDIELYRRLGYTIKEIESPGSLYALPCRN